MLATLRRLIRTHIAGQQEAIAELRGLRAELAALTARLSRLETTAPHTSPAFDAPATLARQLEAIVAQDGRHADPLSLTRHHAQVYSQNGEDGIIAEILRRIGARSRTFLEIGIEAGIQNNTRLLLEQGWRGVWIEVNPDYARQATERFADAIAQGRLAVLAASATPENIDGLLEAAGLPDTIDVLSLDIDQHTAHLWRGLRRRSRVACIEYNACIPPCLPIEVPYVLTDFWDGTNWFGAGLKTLELVAKSKGMHLVGCDLHGVNAFFVDARETAGIFRAPFTAETHYQPPQFGLVTHVGHRPSAAERRWVRAPEAPSDAERPDH